MTLSGHIHKIYRFSVSTHPPPPIKQADLKPWACLLVEIGIRISIRILHTEFLLDIGCPMHE